MAWMVGLAGALMIVTGLLPTSDAVGVLGRAAPVLAFLVAATALARLADTAELFDVAAARAARVGRGHVPLLWLTIVALAVTTTVLLSLDTAAVLLTPVVLVLCRRLGLTPLPFALTVVWLANTASLLLPVSNLTTLLALQRLALSTAAYSLRIAPAALTAVLLTATVLALTHRHQLVGRYVVPPPHPPANPVSTRWAAVLCLALAPLVLAGVPPWLAAASSALVLVLVLRSRSGQWPAIGWPWRLVVGVAGLFLLVTTAGVHGLDGALATAQGNSSSAVGLLRTAGVGAASANTVDNLPAFLALERAVGDGRTDQLLALLVGVGCGPLVTPWGSLATLLWLQGCRDRGVDVPLRRFAALGLLGATVVVAGTTLVLAGT